MDDVLSKYFSFFLCPKAEYCKICDIRRRTDACAAEQFCSNVGEKKKLPKLTEFCGLVYITCNFVTFVTVQWKLPGVCLDGKLSSFLNISQNSISEKQILHKIQYRKNRLFTKFNIRKTDSSQKMIIIDFKYSSGWLNRFKKRWGFLQTYEVVRLQMLW